MPPWRRLLAMFNWRPVYDIEQRELESRKRTQQLESAFEQRELERGKRLKQLENETEQLKSETEQLKKENRRLAELESRMDALLLSADSSSQTPPATGSN